MAWPMPRVEPVTSATRPSSLNSCSVALRGGAARLRAAPSGSANAVLRLNPSTVPNPTSTNGSSWAPYVAAATVAPSPPAASANERRAVTPNPSAANASERCTVTPSPPAARATRCIQRTGRPHEPKDAPEAAAPSISFTCNRRCGRHNYTERCLASRFFDIPCRHLQ
eukprot:scaffold1877_cov67-Phaeocystis_antarctica.AAC.15